MLRREQLRGGQGASRAPVPLVGKVLERGAWAKLVPLHRWEIQCALACFTLHAVRPWEVDEHGVIFRVYRVKLFA